MVRHVVLWKLKQEQMKDRKTLEEMKRRIETLPDLVPHILSLSVGLSTDRSTGSCDICLVSEHKDWDDLSNYRNHPAHLEVANYIREIVEERQFLDYEV